MSDHGKVDAFQNDLESGIVGKALVNWALRDLLAAELFMTRVSALVGREKCFSPTFLKFVYLAKCG